MAGFRETLPHEFHSKRPFLALDLPSGVDIRCRFRLLRLPSVHCVGGPWPGLFLLKARVSLLLADLSHQSFRSRDLTCPGEPSLPAAFFKAAASVRPGSPASTAATNKT